MFFFCSALRICVAVSYFSKLCGGASLWEVFGGLDSRGLVVGLLLVFRGSVVVLLCFVLSIV